MVGHPEAAKRLTTSPIVIRPHLMCPPVGFVFARFLHTRARKSGALTTALSPEWPFPHVATSDNAQIAPLTGSCTLVLFR
jgi:hypothetical protein